MYRLLIVEDEKWEREGLRDFIDWGAMGIELVGCACDGEEGLRIAEERRPDIIIADIKMPKMNGLQMAKLASALLPELQVIILSGYDDFQYARQAIVLHACAYLLKPVERGSLEDALRTALAALDRERSSDLELARLERRWAEYVDSRKDHELFDSLELGGDSASLKGTLPVAGSEDEAARAVAIAAFYRRSEQRGLPEPLSLEAERGLLDAVKTMIRRRGARASFGEHFYEAVLLMESPDGSAVFEAELRSIALELRSELGVEMIAALGDAITGAADIFRSYTQAKVAASYFFVCDCGELLPFRVLSSGARELAERARALILSANEVLDRALRSGGAGQAKCRELVDAFLAELRENRAVSKMLVGYFLLEAGKAAGTLGDSGLGSLRCLEQTRRCLYSAVETLARRAYGPDERGEAPGCGSKEEEVVRCILMIVERSYAEELDLAVLSEEIRLSPYYLGSLFKKRVGKSFSQYLAEYRLDAARRMLREEGAKLCDLSDAIGIHSPSYFSALFKKRFGISPIEYRRIERGRG
jgi:two-component system, response regulator YesN